MSEASSQHDEVLAVLAEPLVTDCAPSSVAGKGSAPTGAAVAWIGTAWLAAAHADVEAADADGSARGGTHAASPCGGGAWTMARAHSVGSSIEGMYAAHAGSVGSQGHAACVELVAVVVRCQCLVQAWCSEDSASHAGSGCRFGVRVVA